MAPRPDPLRSWAGTALSALFLAVLWAPIADMFVRPDSARSTLREQRTPAPPPRLDWTGESLWRFVPRCDAWWRDGFGLRDVLIRARSWIAVFVLPTQPGPVVAVGPDRWVFVATNRALEADLGLFPLTPSELGAWARMFEARRAWLERRGIRLLVAFVPAKSLVYPEHLPRGWAAAGDNRVRQLAAHLGERWRDFLIDLRDTQLAEREHDRPEDGDFAWHPLGSHWTARGAFAGYLRIAKELARLFPGVRPLERGRFERVADPTGGDSWAGRLYLDGCLAQKSWLLQPTQPLHVESLGQPAGSKLDERLRGGDPTAPKLLVFHDSMAPVLRTWLSAHFRETLWIWRYEFDTELIEAEQPDAVLLIYSDRALVNMAPYVTAAEAEIDEREEFARSTRVLLSCDVSANQPPVRAQGGARVAVEGGALVVETSAPSDTLLLPPFDERAAAGGIPVLHLSIECGEEAFLDLLYRTRAEPTYARKRSYRVPLHAGANEVYVELLAPEMFGDLLMRPGRARGRYVVRALEVRAVER